MWSDLMASKDEELITNIPEDQMYPSKYYQGGYYNA
jgi:hypothetical protein